MTRDIEFGRDADGRHTARTSRFGGVVAMGRDEAEAARHLDAMIELVGIIRSATSGTGA